MTKKRQHIKVSELAYFASDREGFKKYGVSTRDSKAAEFGQNKHNSVGTRKRSPALVFLVLIIGGAIAWLLS